MCILNAFASEEYFYWELNSKWKLAFLLYVFFWIEDTIPLSQASIVPVERLGVNQTSASLKVMFFLLFFLRYVLHLFSKLIYYVVSGCGLRLNYLAWKILRFLKLKINIIFFFCSWSAEIFSIFFCSYFNF